MSERGRKHDWRMANIWGDVMPRCSRCGLLGDMEFVTTSNSAGWVGRPTYGCLPQPPSIEE